MSAVVEIRQLTHRYSRAAHPAVNGLDLTVEAGEIVGLLGPNGAGKTTTLHLLLGLLLPTQGTVRVFGASPVTQRFRVLPYLNFASMDVDLPPNLTVMENLSIFAALYGVAPARERINALMKQFALTDFRAHRIGVLSAGEHMRVKLCKALLNAPRLLILDEPTLNLDPHMAQQVRQLLKAIQREQGMAILLTSHNMREVETFCDRIVFLHRGAKLAEGPPQEVMARFNSGSLDELFIRVATTGDLTH